MVGGKNRVSFSLLNCYFSKVSGNSGAFWNDGI